MRNGIKTSILILISICFCAPAHGILTEKSSGIQVESGLVSAFRLNEGAGAAAVDATGTNNGTISGAAWAQGRFSTGLLFDGVNDYINIPDAVSLHMADAITFEAWIYINGFSSVAGMHNEICGKDWNVLRLWAKQEDHKLSLYNVIGGTNQMAYGGTVLVTGKWYHVAFTYDGKSVTLYLDGVVDGSVVCAGALTTGTNAFMIGIYTGGTDFFNGKIDEVRIYNRALSQSEISEHSVSVLSDAFDGGFARKYKFQWNPQANVDLEVRSSVSTSTLATAGWVKCPAKGTVDLEKYFQYRAKFGSSGAYLSTLEVVPQFIKSITISPASPVRTGPLTFDVYFSEDMQKSETPTVEFTVDGAATYKSTKGAAGVGWLRGAWSDSEHYRVVFTTVDGGTGNGFCTVKISNLRSATGETMSEYIDDSLLFIDCDANPIAPASIGFCPNPFSPNGDGRNDKTVLLNLPILSGTARVTAKIYSMKGMLMRILFDGDAGPGAFSIPYWDGFDDGGRMCPVGLYVFQVITGTWARAGTVVLAK